MGEPEPPRHRRRERRRTGAAPSVPAEAPPEYATGSPAPPVEKSAAPERPAPAARPDQPAAGTAPAAQADQPAGGAAGAGQVEGPPGKRKPRTRRVDAERGLRGIVGAGPSQVGVVGAMRARDAAKPTAEDLAEAERDVVVVRRHYVPPDSLPGAR